MSLRASWQAVRTGFWAIPSACIVAAIALGLVLVRLDRVVGDDPGLAFDAGPEGAREVLSAISTSMITFTGLVFSITIVVLQLTSSQFSPRVLRTFLRDRLTQFALGTFVATFVYSVTVLRTVTSGNEAFVPAISTTVGLGLLLLSVGMFVAYIHHIATAIQVSSILAAIGAETRQALERRYPEHVEEVPAGTVAPTAAAMARIVAPRSGVVTRIDTARLVAMARDADVVLRTGASPGDYLPEGAPIVEVLGPGAVDDKAVAAAFTLSRDRTRSTTSPSDSGNLWTSLKGLCRPGSTTPRQRSRRSTSSTTSCADSPSGCCLTDTTATSTRRYGSSHHRRPLPATSGSRWRRSTSTAGMRYRCNDVSTRC